MKAAIKAWNRLPIAITQAASLLLACSNAKSMEKENPRVFEATKSGLPRETKPAASNSLSSMAIGQKVGLPPARTKGGMSLFQSLAFRRSVRSYAPRVLTPEELSQLVWAAQGVTSSRGFRTAPSAGATYPIELYLLIREGVFRYQPGDHALWKLAGNDRRSHLAEAALGQNWIRTAPLSFVIAGITERTAKRYGQRSERYVVTEAGAVAQNIMLAATALDLGSVIVGAYDDLKVATIAMLQEGATPIALVSVGERH